jgi:epoxyqueuosine reductase
MNKSHLLDAIESIATEEGFILCGVAAAVEAAGFHALVSWIKAGYCADMTYFADRQEAYRHPSGVLPGAKSIVALAYPYPAGHADTLAPNHGRVARYTWIDADYHDIIHPKLKRICRLVRESMPNANARGVVDTAPLMEREFAQLAGLGWRGKNTLLLNKHLGSYFFLACVLIDVDLPASDPHTTSHCGTCTACLDACPTDAFPEPGVLDATKCISYLTIENRDEIPQELREGIGDWVFGCDICQEVCPWNTKPTRAAGGTDSRSAMDLIDLLKIGEEEFRKRFRKSPMWRTRRRGMLRNAAIVLGNIGNEQAVQALTAGSKDGDAVIADACHWALAKIVRRN